MASLLQSQLSAAALIRHLGLYHVDKESPAVILYTSGTEAVPKTVPLTHANLIGNGRTVLSVSPLRNDDRLVSFLPPFHSFGFTATGLIPLLAGMKTIYSPDPLNGRQLACQIAASRATVLAAAPTFLDAICRVAQPEQLQSLRLIVLGAEKAPPGLIDRVRQMVPSVEVIMGYGITECSPIVTLQRLGEVPEGVGKPLPEVELLIVHSETLEPLPTGQQGLILIRGPGVFKGYLGDSKSPFVEVQGKQWYNSGDLGYVDRNGTLFLSGRFKRFIKIGGEMVSLSAVQGAILERLRQHHADITPNAIAVIAKEDQGRPTLIGFATKDISVDEANEAIRNYGISNLARLAEIRHVDPMPLTSTGKIDYRKLEKTLTEQPIPGGSHSPG
jgi:long-chain-fatty-acid--[acyl-carrier-protein] ligase